MTRGGVCGRSLALPAAALAAALVLVGPGTSDASRYVPQALVCGPALPASPEDLAVVGDHHHTELLALSAADRLDLADLAPGACLERRERAPGPPTREELLEALEAESEAGKTAEAAQEQATRGEKPAAHPAPRIHLDEVDPLSLLAANGLAEAAGRQRRRYAVQWTVCRSASSSTPRRTSRTS